MQIKTQLDDAYSESIRKFLINEFPVSPIVGKDLLEALTDAIIGTGQVRNGPKPSPETTVAIRQIISRWTVEDQPIPFVAVWGSEKPDWSGIDVAELGALKTIKCLNSRVQQFYPPGVKVNIRLEEASAPHLFFDNMEQARAGAKLYTNGLANLLNIVEQDFTKAILESRHYSEEVFNKEADFLLPYLHAAVVDPYANTEELEVLGWKGKLSRDFINSYVEGSYLKLYPNANLTERAYRFARYLSAALARKRLGYTGANESWGTDYITLSFVNPTKGEASGKRIYYKTMPSAITSNHIPPWRAKGYLKIKGDEVRASLASFADKLEYNKHQLTLEGNGLSQVLQADYVVED